MATAAIFCGGLVRHLAERGQERSSDDEAGPGALYASGLIAAGGIVGLLGIAVKVAEKQGWIPKDTLDIGHLAPGIHDSDILGILAFAALAGSLYHFARKPLHGAK